MKLFKFGCMMLGILLTVNTAGCVKKAQNTETSKNVQVETIKVWTNEGSSKEAIVPMVEKFNDTIGLQKGIKIEYTVHGGDYKNVIDMAIAAAQTPDIFALPGAMLPYVQSDRLMEIEKLPGGSEFLKKYEGKLIPLINVVKGKTYSVPFSVRTIGLLYNKNMFKEAGIVDEKGEARPPQTWSELVEDAKKLTNPAQQKYGLMIPLKWNGYFNWEVMYPMVSSIGNAGFDYKTGQFDFSKLKPALEALNQIRQQKLYFPGAEGVDNDPARAHFAEGRVAMKFGVSWDVGVLNDQFPAKIDWGVAQIPVVDVNTQYKQCMFTSAFACVSANPPSKNLEKIMEVYKWFNSEDFLLKMYENGKYIPYDPEITKKAVKKDSKKGWDDFCKLAEVSQTITSLPAVKVIGDDYNSVFTKIWFNTGDIDDKLADLNKRYNEALQKAVADGTIDISVYKNEKFDNRLK